ncbi:MAG: exonuclease SbcCD subunit D [Hyphomicrobiales bacterium]
MIRLLHTADWHLGHQLKGWDRAHEHVRFFDALVDIVGERRVDGLIVAGDIFDHQNPSADAERLLMETVGRLKAARPSLTVVLIAGNHDSAGRIEVPRALYASAGIHAIGALRGRSEAPDMARHLVPIRDEAGAVGAHVLALPYLRAADLPGLAAVIEPGAPSPIAAAVGAVYAEHVAAARAIIGDEPLIATGHLHVSGAALSESTSERRILVGGEHAVPASIFPEGLAYVALGHLHRPQWIGRETVRYSGAPFPMSVAEQGYRHGVSLVEIDGGQATVEHVPVERPVAFLRVPASGRVRPEGLAEAFAALSPGEDLAERDWPFAQVMIEIDGPAPTLHATVDEIAASYPLRIVSIDVARPEAAAAGPEPVLVRLAERSPEDIFRAAFLAAHGVEPEPAHLLAFRRAVEEAGS